jgi:transposase
MENALFSPLIQVILYDITSVYFEGEYKDSELVAFGYSRDGKEQFINNLHMESNARPHKDPSIG